MSRPTVADPVPIIDVACPTCTESVAIPLPRGYADLEVSESADPEKPEDNLHHTRRVRCDAGHAVYFYFRRTYRPPAEDEPPDHPQR